MPVEARNRLNLSPPQLFEHCLVKLVLIVEIVHAHPVFWRRSIIGHAGADHWNISVAHNKDLVLMFWLHLPKQANQSSHAARARQCAIKRSNSAVINRTGRKMRAA